MFQRQFELFADVPGGFAVGGTASTVMSAVRRRMLGAKGGEGPMPPQMSLAKTGTNQLCCGGWSSAYDGWSPSYISATHQESDPIPLFQPFPRDCMAPSQLTLI